MLVVDVILLFRLKGYKPWRGLLMFSLYQYQQIKMLSNFV